MSGFALPPYPYDRLRTLLAAAQSHPGGAVDCSVGTPCDPPPESALHALATSPTVRDYPPAAGSPALLEAATAWMRRRFGVDISSDHVVPCVGTKELVASIAQHLRLRSPGRDTVLYPALSYPTYAMGAALAGCRALPVPSAEGEGTPNLDTVSADDARRALALWVNSPANPCGTLTDLGRVVEWGRAHGVPILSDECYVEFTWYGAPRTALEHGTEGVVAVHSLSKRSNMAGLRVGFIAGDRDLVGFLREVRRHAGLMVPGPVQAAGTAALADDEHVERQRTIYRERLSYFAPVLADAGCLVAPSAGGFYLWARVPAGGGDDGRPAAATAAAGNAWAYAAHLAEAGGLLVSPGDLYGAAGAGHIRVAMVQPMERLRLVATRLAGHGQALALA